MSKKLIVILSVIVLTFGIIPALAEFNVPDINPDLLNIDMHGGTVIRSSNFDLTKAGAAYGAILNMEFLALDGIRGCYRISRKEALHGSPYFYSRSSFPVKPNTNYYVSALIYTDFDKTDSEVNLSFASKNSGAKTTLISYCGLPPKTEGWQRYEKIVTTPSDAVTAGIGGMVAGFKDESDLLCLSDMFVIEMPAESLVPLGVGEGMIFGGSSGNTGMKVEEVAESPGSITVRVTGAEYVFDKQNDRITAKQLINRERKVTTINVSKPLAALTLKSRSLNEAVLTTGEGGLTFGVQMDGLMLISTHGDDAEITCTSEIGGEWNRFVNGQLMAADSIGGFTVNPAIPMGTGRLPRAEALSDIDFNTEIGNTELISRMDKGWGIRWTISSGERLGVSVFPPKKYDWEGSFDCTYANFDMTETLPYEAYKKTYGVKYGVLWSFTQRGWGMSYGNKYIPINESEYIRHINAAKSAGITPAAYMSMYFWHNRDIDEYVNEVKRHRDTYGIEGVYSDGLPDKEWLVAYEGVRKLRDLFPEGCIIVHTTGQPSNGGPPLATPEISIPAIDAYATITLRGEDIPYAGSDWKYPLYITSGYNTSNSFGIQKGNLWTDENGVSIAQTDQYLINLLYNGRLRRAGGDWATSMGILSELKENYRINGASPDFYEECYLPMVRKLVREKISGFDETRHIEGGQMVLSEEKAEDEIRFAPAYGKVILEYEVTADENYSGKQIISDDNDNIALAISFCKGKIRYLSGLGGFRTIGGFEGSTSVKIIADTADETYDLYIGGVLAVKGATFYHKVAGQSKLKFINDSNMTGSIRYDNISVIEGV